MQNSSFARVCVQSGLSIAEESKLAKVFESQHKFSKLIVEDLVQ